MAEVDQLLRQHAGVGTPSGGRSMDRTLLGLALRSSQAPRFPRSGVPRPGCQQHSLGPRALIELLLTSWGLRFTMLSPQYQYQSVISVIFSIDKNFLKEK